MRDTFRAETEALRSEVKTVQAELRNATTLPKETKLQIQLQQAQKAIKEIATRQEKLEQVILANPTKALEIPLLQRDLDSVKAAHQENLAVLKDAVNRIYDLNKWLLGAMAVSIVTLAISNFLKGKQ